MSGHFTLLYKLPENLYTTGSPVIIEAGSLLKDETSGAIVAQLKIKNIQSSPIRAITVAVCAMDTGGRQLGPEIAFDYLDLNVQRDASFGEQTPLLFPNNATRQFYVRVIEVIFPGKEIWNGDGKIWRVLPKSESLESAFPDYEMRKQFQLRFGNQCIQKAYVYEDLWICACGGINHHEEQTCHNCRLAQGNILSPDLESLREEKDARVKREREEREAERRREEERQAKLQAEREAKKEKVLSYVRKYWKYALAAFLVILFLAIVPRQIGKAIKESRQKRAYSAAMELKEAGSFDEAIDAFEKLGDYMDSEEQVEIVEDLKTEAENQKAYDEATALAAAKKYDEAIKAFRELGDYKDSEEQVQVLEDLKEEAENQKAYDEAAALAEAKKYDKAINAFRELGDYKDSEEQVEILEELKTEEENQKAYNEALALFKEEKYEEARRTFGRLKGYKDSEEKAKEAEEKARKNNNYEKAVSLLNEGNYSYAEDLLKELGSYKDSKELLKSIPERRRKAAVEKVTGVVLEKGKAFENGDFSGKAIEWNNSSNLFSIYCAASEGKPDVFHMYAIYKGPKQEYKDITIHMVMDGTDVSYDLTMPFEFNDKTVVNVYESGSFKAAGYRPGMAVVCEEIDAPEGEKKVKGFSDRKEIRELPTQYIADMMSVLEDILTMRELKLEMSDLGFYIYGER